MSQIRTKLPLPPYDGQWVRGEEHESMFKLATKDGRIRITVEAGGILGDGRKQMERFFVETFKMWPHPDAPREDGEHNYPTYRNEAYARLCAETG